MTERKPSFNRYVDMLKKALNIFKSNQDFTIVEPALLTFLIKKMFLIKSYFHRKKIEFNIYQYLIFSLIKCVFMSFQLYINLTTFSSKKRHLEELETKIY